MNWNLEEASRCHAEGRRCLFLGQSERALAWFDQALQAFPRDDRAMAGRGDAFFSLDRFQEAAACYEEAERLIRANGPLWSESEARPPAACAPGRPQEACATEPPRAA